ncbi:MAG: hypothetical protein JNL01_14170 [Bdellovibrionales bacterium]|nr:hypothetical protein [Bdellovibrionales bacterium]
MIIKINDNISIWQEYNPFDLSFDRTDSYDSRRTSARFGFNKERVLIQDRWFDVLSPSELVRKRNLKDGYYRVLYIQLNWGTGEYYIGKANRPKWSELKRYQGSGLKFKSKFNKHKDEFVRYFIAVCETAEETEKLEASIVTVSLLSDDKCLNLVAGGGGTSKRPTIAETSEKKREYMKKHPEQFKAMLTAAKEAFSSGDTPALRARSQKIKEVMSDDKYRKMSQVRIINWKNNNPEEYAEARRKSREKIKSSEVQEKRQASLKRYAEQNPDEYKIWQEKLIKSRTSPKANEKRKLSLKKFKDNNPELAHSNAKKRAKAAAAKTSKAVSMIDLNTGKVLKEFSSIHEAARWLVETGIAKNTNCASSISSVCLRKPCTTGYGNRKKAYGYDWRFTDDLK